MLRRKKVVAASSIAMMVVLAVAVYAALYGSVTTPPYSVKAIGEQLNLGIDGIFFWDCSKNDTYPISHTTPATTLAAGQTYTLFLGVNNTLTTPTGPTYMKYTLTADQGFRLAYLTNYTECNIDGKGVTSDYWFPGVYWYEEYVDGKYQVTMWVPSDPYTIPADYWFITETWFTLNDTTPTLTGFTWTMQEYNAAWTHPAGVLLPNVCNLPDHTKDYTYSSTWPTWPVHWP